MVLQRPVACEQHASTSAWSAAASRANLRPETQVALPPGPVLAPAEADRAAPDRLPNPDVMVLFSRAEYQRLAALRARVQKQLQQGDSPDELGAPRHRADDASAPRP